MLTLGGVSDPYIAAVPEAGLLEFKTVDGVPELGSPVPVDAGGIVVIGVAAGVVGDTVFVVGDGDEENDE